jgi:hypothetical protein
MTKKSSQKSVKLVAEQKNKPRRAFEVFVDRDIWTYGHERYFSAIESGIEVLSVLAETCPDQDDDTLRDTTISVCFALRPMLEGIKSLRLGELPLLNFKHPHFKEIRTAVAKAAREAVRTQSTDDVFDVFIGDEWRYRYGRFFTALEGGFELLSALADTGADQANDTLRSTLMPLCSELLSMLDDIKTLHLEELPLLNIQHPQFQNAENAVINTASKIGNPQSAKKAA